MRNWQPFTTNEIVAATRILEILTPGERLQRKLMYRVAYLCCGVTRDVSHATLLGRTRRSQRLCAHCSRAAANALRAQEARDNPKKPSGPITISSPGLSGIHQHLARWVQE